jgi:hypothetical protein
MVEDRILVSFRQDNRATVILASLAGISSQTFLGFPLEVHVEFVLSMHSVFAIVDASALNRRTFLCNKKLGYQILMGFALHKKC